MRNIASAAVRPTPPHVLDMLDKACNEHVERIAPLEARGRLYRRRLVINFHGCNWYRGKKLVSPFFAPFLAIVFNTSQFSG